MATRMIFCDPCKESGDEKDGVGFCIVCRELYCQPCFDYHRKLRALKTHPVVKVSGSEPGDTCPCEICNTNAKIAVSLCNSCRELYCTECTLYHGKFRGTKDHTVVALAATVFPEVSELATVMGACAINVTYSGAQMPLASKNNDKGQRNPSGNDDNAQSEGPLHSSDDLGSEAITKKDINKVTDGVKFHLKFSFRTSTDNPECKINRIIALPDDRLVLVTHNRCKLKLFSVDYQLLDEMKVQLCRSAVNMDGETIAVANGRKIDIYSLKGNRIAFVKTVANYKFDVYDIALRGEEFVVRCREDQFNESVFLGQEEIIKEKGNVALHDFMTYDPIADIVLLGDFSDRRLSCFDTNGFKNWEKKFGEEPTGIVIIRGIICVALYKSNGNVHQLTLDGQYISKVLPENSTVAEPSALCHQSKEDRLLVGSSSNDEITVFDLS